MLGRVNRPNIKVMLDSRRVCMTVSSPLQTSSASSYKLQATKPITQQQVWPPGSADTVSLRRPMTQVQHWAKTSETDHVTLRP